MPTIKTIGELKALIQDMDDSLPVISKDSNYETGHALQDGAFMEVERMSTRTKHCRDDFDHTHYTIQEYVHDPEGKRVLVIR